MATTVKTKLSVQRNDLNDAATQADPATMPPMGMYPAPAEAGNQAVFAILGLVAVVLFITTIMLQVVENNDYSSIIPKHGGTPAPAPVEEPAE